MKKLLLIGLLSTLIQHSYAMDEGLLQHDNASHQIKTFPTVHSTDETEVRISNSTLLHDRVITARQKRLPWVIRTIGAGFRTIGIACEVAGATLLFTTNSGVATESTNTRLIAGGSFSTGGALVKSFGDLCVSRSNREAAQLEEIMDGHVTKITAMTDPQQIQALSDEFYAHSEVYKELINIESRWGEYVSTTFKFLGMPLVAGGVSIAKTADPDGTSAWAPKLGPSLAALGGALIAAGKDIETYTIAAKEQLARIQKIETEKRKINQSGNVVPIIESESNA